MFIPARIDHFQLLALLLPLSKGEPLMAHVIHRIHLAAPDAQLLDLLLPTFEARAWKLEYVGPPEAYVQDLEKHARQGRLSANHIDPTWFRRYFCPLLLEVDCADQASMEILRNIKLLYGALPVIIIGTNVDWTALAVARLDGADALFRRDDLRPGPLTEAVRDALARVDRWCGLVAQFLNTAVHQGGWPPTVGYNGRVL